MGLVERVEGVFRECVRVWEEREMMKEEREKQKRHCRELADKVPSEHLVFTQRTQLGFVNNSRYMLTNCQLSLYLCS